ncbi:hypothetical protein [Bacteroides sp.]|uniref:hypothetical protein n=1 Tax=Bacteroides sp. TaxID=29523 RepID=UPI002621BA09|nr:hypothetical protein [Bacteroides sp.]MDD3040412.1 hypothetical protein [Bacteroides sp.]
MEQEALFPTEWVEKLIKETRRGLLSLQAMDPIFTSDEWYKQTRVIKEKVSGTQMVCDGAYSLRGNTDYDTGLIGIMEIRDEVQYMFELVLWCEPGDIAHYNWSYLNERLEYCWQLVQGVKEKLPPVSTVHNLGKVEGVIRDIVDTYLDPSTDAPWKLGISWGKDSTSVLQLVLEALERIPREKWTRPINLVTSDTCLELPPMLKIIRKNSSDFGKYSQDHNLPFEVHVVKPSLEERFWTNLIGKGYTPPLGGPVKRWCTPRLKIQPQSRLDKDLLSQYKNIVAVLGTRYDESVSREISMKKWEGKSRYGYTVTPNVLSYTPIAHLNTNQVWDVIKHGFWWGNNYKMLADLYRASSFDETITEGGRMGCAVCFVVKRDKSLTNLISNGYEWLQPLIDYRELVLEVVQNRFYREPIPIDRRTGLPTKSRNHKVKAVGGINQKGREYLLGKLLETQAEIQNGMAAAGFEVEGGYELISAEEIQWIKSWWNHLSGYTEDGFTSDQVVEKVPDLQLALF